MFKEFSMKFLICGLLLRVAMNSGPKVIGKRFLNFIKEVGSK
jgi:hypothetical protein